MLLYASSWHTTFGKNSDHANAVLAGRDIVSGHPLLDGWVLPLNTYWSLDLSFLAAFTVLGGVRPAAMNAVPVVIAAAVLFVGGLIACRNSASSKGRLVGVGVVALLLGLPHPLLGNFFLQGPEHVATALYCLVAFFLLAGVGIGRRKWFVGVGVLMAAVLGDAFALALGGAPILAAGAMASLRQRRWAPLFSPGVAAVGAAGGAALIRFALNHLNAHSLAPALPLSPPGNWIDNVNAVRRLIPMLLGFGEDSGLSGFFELVHVLGVAIFVAGVVAGVVVTINRLVQRRSEGPGEAVDESAAWFDDVLVVGLVGGLCMYVLITLPPSDVHSSRYLTPTVIFGTVLAARRAASLVERLSARRARALVGALVALLGLYAAASLDVLLRPSVVNPAQELAEWLADNGLTSGFGTYWTASIATVSSGQSVTVRPVVAVDGRLRGWLYYASKEWFEPDPEKPRRFLVYQPGQPFRDVDDHSATATFGPFARAVDLGTYRILIWDKDLSPALGSPWRDR